jgi:tetratricopeptide (TPR) repeat protein
MLHSNLLSRGGPRVNEHPTAVELEGFVWNRVPSGRTREIVGHIVRGCVQCRAVLAPHFAGLLGLEEPPAPVLTTEEDAQYDAAIGRAFSSVLERARELRQERKRETLSLLSDAGEELPEVPVPLRGVPLFECLLQLSWALRHENPAEMVRLAEQARELAETFDAEELGASAVADLQCRAWVEVGNAYRVADDLAAAERALGAGTERYLEGTQDETLAARLFSVQASLLGDSRRFDLAETALDLVFTIHRRRGDDHEAGRALLKKGIFAGYQGSSEAAIQLIEQGLGLLDEERDPRLVFQALHNLARLLLDAGQLREARMALWKAKARGLDAGGRVDVLKVRWLEGQINAGLGELERAEAALREVKEGFASAGLGYKAALAGLELGSVLLRQGRSETAVREVLASANVFISLGISREAAASVLLLQKALERQIVDSALLEYVIALLHRSEFPAERALESAGE